LGEVRHLAREQFEVGVAHADAVNVDDDLPRTGTRDGDLVDDRPAWSGDHQGAHRAQAAATTSRRRMPRASIPSSITSSRWSNTGGLEPCSRRAASRSFV
jgi:hypothetical protein